MYLWCSRCFYATNKDRWRFDIGKYGTCPKCGCSSYKTAVEWPIIAIANGYTNIPSDQPYPIQPSLF